MLVKLHLTQISTLNDYQYVIFGIESDRLWTSDLTEAGIIRLTAHVLPARLTGSGGTINRVPKGWSRGFCECCVFAAES